jgi:hypothetical protein
MIRAILLVVLTAATCAAAVLYDNTNTDQQFSVFYSTGFTEIGDQLQLVSPGQMASLDTQFFNNGADATFDATVTFYNTGSPVGSQIGPSFTISGNSIASNTSQTVTFANLGGLPVPADVIVVLSIQNVSAGGDIGVNFFDPPTVGTSDNTFFIANDGTGLAQVSTNLDIDNVHFLITAVPEPGTAGATFGALLLLAWSWRRSRSVND